MYFWNIHALAEKLRRGSLTERQKMLYLLFYLLIVIFNASIGKTSASPWEISNFLVDGAAQAITAVVCFQANSAGDGRNFLERYVCLQVPLTIRFWVVLCSAAVFLGAVAPTFICSASQQAISSTYPTYYFSASYGPTSLTSAPSSLKSPLGRPTKTRRPDRRPTADRGNTPATPAKLLSNGGR